YPDVEVVVVDDGSTDDSRDIIRSYGHDIIVELKENGGQTSAMNAGFARSTGDIVCFLAANDSLFPWAAEAADALLSEPDVARAVWRLLVVDPAGHGLGLLRQETDAQASAAEMLRCGEPAVVPTTTSANAWSRRYLESFLPLPEIEDEVGCREPMADAL